MLVIENFCSDYEALKTHAENACFSDEANPVDGVIYPMICKDVPEFIFSDLEREIKRSPKNPVAFLRRSPSGVKCPHIFHNDISMGNFSLMLYLNTIDGGTGMARHVETGHSRPAHGVDYSKDQNDGEKWDVYRVCEAVENRACIFDASLFHCALPIGGFGYGKYARTVLTVFFS